MAVEAKVAAMEEGVTAEKREVMEGGAKVVAVRVVAEKAARVAAATVVAVRAAVVRVAAAMAAVGESQALL